MHLAHLFCGVMFTYTPSHCNTPFHNFHTTNEYVKLEVVLCPYLPDNSHFLLKFKTVSVPTPPPSQPIPKPTYHPLYGSTIPPYISRAPDSPSAEVSPHPSSGGKLNGFHSHSHTSNRNTNNANVNAQLQLLNAALALLQSGMGQQQQRHPQQPLLPRLPVLPSVETVPREFKERHPDTDTIADGDKDESEKLSPDSIANETHIGNDNGNPSTDELIERQLRQLNELFLLRNVGVSVTDTAIGNDLSDAQTNLKDVVLPDPSSSAAREKSEELHELNDPQLLLYWKSQEKKQVIFTIANYFVLFMSLIALSAEIQSRLPQWMDWVQDNYDSVQNCATDNDALFECISQGNFSGLVASFVLWATQSASAKRIFLFGFDTPKKLWTVVYEALVTAVCWGTSYIFIRRGLNPNTRERFLQKVRWRVLLLILLSADI